MPMVVVELDVSFSTRSSIRVVLSVVYLAISEAAWTHPFIEVLGGFVPSVLPVSVAWLYNSVIELVKPELFGGASWYLANPCSHACSNITLGGTPTAWYLTNRIRS